MTGSERINILGVGIGAVNMSMAVATIERWLASRDPNYVIAAPVHCVMECQRDQRLRHIYNSAGLVTPDGMPLVWVSWLMGFDWVDRVYGPDLMLAMCQRSLAKGYTHYLYGATPEVVDKLALRLSERFPGLQILGRYSPPFRPLTPDEDRAVVERINASSADIVWVGLGAAKEEFWMNEHVGRVKPPVLIGVGAAFDFHSGGKPQAPRWLQRAGLEWLFRLATEPRRLWKRYCINNPLFVAKILLQALGKTPAGI